MSEEGHGSPTKSIHVSPSSSNSIGRTKELGKFSSKTVAKERHQLSTTLHSRKVFETTRPVFTHWVLVLLEVVTSGVNPLTYGERKRLILLLVDFFLTNPWDTVNGTVSDSKIM